MANNYFSFKQFTVYQDKAAMKVCTDACLFGAYTALKIKSILPESAHILDIGTGTGLLSLMLAQKLGGNIDALEINAAAAMQANENVQNSSWKERINVIHTSAEEYKSALKYDLIICNPPFYENDLRSPDMNRNAAMHDTSLTLKTLSRIIASTLSGNGYASVLLPFSRSRFMESESVKHGLHVTHRVLIRQTAEHNYFRTILFLSPLATRAETATEIIIHDSAGKYTPEFSLILKDYYLKL